MTKRARSLLPGSVALLLFLGGADIAPGQEPGGFEVQLAEGEGDYPTGSLFIQGLDSIWTATGEVVAGGSILIRDGVIQAVGADVETPDDVEVLDGAGLTAIPGIVDEHSHTAMESTNEGSGAVVPEVRVLDALDAEDFGIYRALSGGVTTARIMHGSANPIGGQSAVIKMRWGMERGHQLLLPGAPRFVKFALGENVTDKNFRQSGEELRFPASRPGVEAVYVEAFTAAREYADEWRRYEESPDAFRVPPRRDLRLDALVDIMEGRIRVHAHSYRSDEILMLMRIAERFGFRIDVFTHVLEGYQVAEEMAEHGAAGSTFSDWWQYKLEAFDAIPFNAVLMHEHGVLTALNSDISWLQSFMIHEIPKPVKYGGVAKEDALRMLTLNPARMMHIDDKVGSLEAGKQGDVVLLNGDPFDAYVRVEKTIVDGIVYYDLADEAGTRDEPFEEAPALEPGAPVADASAVTLPVDRGRDTGEGLLETRSFALVGGTVHPVASQPVEDGVVVVRSGRITAVGSREQVQVPGDLRIVDVSGRHVYPGMIDPITTLGLLEFGQSGNATDVVETGDYSPHVRAISAYQVDNPAIGVARANGITTALTAQRSGVVQGTGSVVQLRGRSWEEAAVDADGALVVDFPAPREPAEDDGWTLFARSHGELERGGPVSGHGASAFTAMAPSALSSVPLRAYVRQEGGEGEPAPTLEGERMEELVALFRRARLYVAEPSVRRRATEPFWPNRWAGDRVILEGMAPALSGEVPVFFRVDTEWQLRTLFLFLDEFPEIRGVAVGGAEAFTVADELARRGIPVILTSAYSPTPSRDHSITASYRNAALLHRAGVEIAFGTDDSSDVRNLPYHAAHSVAFGLPREAGLRAVTLGPAEILGLGGSTGSLEAGKRADILLTDGDPLQFLTQVKRMWIGGVEVEPEDNKHRRLYEEYRAEESP